MLNPIRRFRSQRIPIIWKYPAPFDYNCSLLLEDDSILIACKNNKIYKRFEKHGISQMTDCPTDALLYFIYMKEYPLIFNIKSEKSESGDVLCDKIEIQISDPDAFLYSLMTSKSIVSAATSEIHIIQSLNEAVKDCENNVSIDRVNEKLREKSFGIKVIYWRCKNKDEDRRSR